MQEELRRHRGISRRAVMLHVAVLGSEAIADVPAPVQNVLVAPRSSSVGCDNPTVTCRPPRFRHSFRSVHAHPAPFCRLLVCAFAAWWKLHGSMCNRRGRGQHVLSPLELVSECNLGCALGEALSTPTAA